MSNNQEYQEHSTSIKKSKSKVKVQEPTDYEIDQNFTNNCVEVFDPSVYHHPPANDKDFHVADGLVVHQHDTATNHKSYGNMIIHEKSEINLYPTSAQMMLQRNQIEDWDKKFLVGKQSIAVISNRIKGFNKTLTSLKLKPDFDVPAYNNLSRFDEDLSFSGDVSARENIKFNCQRFDDGGWVLDENRVNDLSSLIEIEHNLDDCLEIENPKAFFNNLRIIRANRERNGSSSSAPSVHNLPESSSSVQEEVFAQGNSWNATMRLAKNSDYNDRHDLMNNKEIMTEIENFKEESKEREDKLKQEIEKLKFEVERSEHLRKNKENQYKRLRSRVKAIHHFVYDESKVNEQSSTVEVEFSEATVRAIDWSKPVPVQVKRFKIEHLSDLVDHAIFQISDSDTEDDEEIVTTTVVTKTVQVEVTAAEAAAEFIGTTDLAVHGYQNQGVPQGMRISPAHFQRILDERENSPNEWDSDDDILAVRVTDSEDEDGDEASNVINRYRTG